MFPYISLVYARLLGKGEKGKTRRSSDLGWMGWVPTYVYIKRRNKNSVVTLHLVISAWYLHLIGHNWRQDPLVSRKNVCRDKTGILNSHFINKRWTKSNPVL